jgi:hypothetical protein
LERTGRERGVEPNGMDLSCPMRPLERWAMKMRRLVIVKGMETRFLICPRMLRSIGDWSKAPTLFWIGAMASLMKRGS